MIRPALCAIFASAVLLVAQPALAGAQIDYQSIRSLIQQNHLADALNRVNQLIAQNPHDAKARFLKGLILAEQNKTTDAIAVMTGLTEDFPELPEPWNNLAVLYAAQGKYGQAQHALEMAIHTNPSYATANENLGDLYARMASQAYDKALQIDKSNPKIYTKLALIKEIVTGKPVEECSPAPYSGKTPVTASQVTVNATPTVKTPEPTNTAVNPVTTADNNTAANPATKTDKSSLPAAANVAPPTPVAVIPSTDPNNSTANTAASTSVTQNSPGPEAPPPADDINLTQSVVSAVQAWAHDWSSQNVNAYLAAYAPDFKLPAGLTRSQWEALRTQRITRPKQIHVELQDIQVSRDDADHFTVNFTQIYQSDRLHATDQKSLKLERSQDHWLITEEWSH